MDTPQMCCHFLLVAFFALMNLGWLEARGRGGGGFRGGGGGVRGSRGSSSRGSGSTGSRFTSSSVRSPHRFSSTYVSYVPSVRYTRAYSSSRIGSGYWLYYSMYFSYARSSYYMSRRRTYYDDGVGVCVNYEAEPYDNEDSFNSTSGGNSSATLGIFTCPLLEEEPRSYTQCCGDKYAEYCCEKSTSDTVVMLAKVIGCVICAILVIGVTIYWKKRKMARKTHRGQVIAAPGQAPTSQTGAVNTNGHTGPPVGGAAVPPGYGVAPAQYSAGPQFTGKGNEAHANYYPAPYSAEPLQNMPQPPGYPTPMPASAPLAPGYSTPSAFTYSAYPAEPPPNYTKATAT